MNRVFFWSIVSALAGFLFGFDTVVISGAEKSLQALWNLDDFTHGLSISMALWGTVIGSLVGGWPTDKFGRRATLLSIGVLYLVSAIGSALAGDVISFMVARFVGGLGVGISTVAAPLYISEIAPPEKRGRLAGLFQFNIVFGILVAFLSNFLIGRFLGPDAWRWMLGIEALPALVYSLMCFGLPESPRWLLTVKKDRGRALEVLAKSRPDLDAAGIEAEADRIAASTAGDAEKRPRFWTSRLRIPILLAFLVAVFNQLSGINAILYFAPRILGLSGLEDPLLASVSIGVTNLVFTFVGLRLIDRLGRRTLLYIGSVGYIVSLGVCGWAFLHFAEFKVIAAADALLKADSAETRSALIEAAELARYRGAPVTIEPESAPETVAELAGRTIADASDALGGAGSLVLVCIIGFIAAHAVGQGTVIWVLISEIFPNRFRAAGQSLGSFTHWIFAALLTLVFPKAITAFPAGYVFLFFCGMMVLQLIWVKLMVPETKGVPLEDIERQLGIRERRR